MEKDNLTHPKATAGRTAEFDTALQAYMKSYREEQRKRRNGKEGKPAAPCSSKAGSSPLATTEIGQQKPASRRASDLNAAGSLEPATFRS